MSLTLGQQYEVMAGGLFAEEKVTFAGGAAGDAGTLSSTPYTLFTVTGLVKVVFYAVAEVDLVSSSGTIKVGVKRSDVPGGGLDTTASLIASTTASQIDTFEVWNGANPQATLITSNATNFPENVISRDIILTVGTADITAGRVKFVCQWKPLTEGSSVVARHLGISASASPSASPSPSASLSPSASISPSASKSASVSPSASTSPSSSLSPSASQSLSPSSSASSSTSLSLSPSASTSPSSSLSPSSSTSSSPSASLSPSSSRSPSSSSSASISPSASLSPSSSTSISPSASLSPSTSLSPSPSPSP